MMNYRKLLMLIIITTGLVLSGCRNVGDNINLIESPDLSNEKQEDIKEAIDKFLPLGTEYITPKNLEQKQSIFLEDIDQDGKQEAFVLHLVRGENQRINLLVLQNADGIWNKVSDVPTDGIVLDYFSIEDLNRDGKKEVVIGTEIPYSEPMKQLNIYEWVENNLEMKVNRIYEFLDIDDYNDDGKPDILILDGERNKSQTAKIFNYDKGELISQSLVELNPDAYHENVISGKLVDGKKALFIDSGLGAHSMLTEIVAYNNGKLMLIGDPNDGFLLKEYPLYSRDINNNGLTEVGGMYIPKGWEDEAFAGIPFIYVFADYNIDGTRETIEERFVDNEQHFYITIPPEWYQKFTIKKIDNGVNLISNADQQKLFEVKWIDKESYTNSKNKLGETEDIIFYNDSKSNSIIPIDNFHLFEEEF